MGIIPPRLYGLSALIAARFPPWKATFCLQMPASAVDHVISEPMIGKMRCQRSGSCRCAWQREAAKQIEWPPKGIDDCPHTPVKVSGQRGRVDKLTNV